MKQFLLRSNALNRLKKIEQQAAATKNPEAVKYASKAYNAVLSMPVEKQIYCQCCGEKINGPTEPLVHGDYLDNIAKQFYVERRKGEADWSLRERILEEIKRRSL